MRLHVSPFVAAVAEAGDAGQCLDTAQTAEAAIPTFAPRSVGRIAIHNFAAHDACGPQSSNSAVQALLELKSHLLDTRCVRTLRAVAASGVCAHLLFLPLSLGSGSAQRCCQRGVMPCTSFRTLPRNRVARAQVCGNGDGARGGAEGL